MYVDCARNGRGKPRPYQTIRNLDLQIEKGAFSVILAFGTFQKRIRELEINAIPGDRDGRPYNKQ